ncbi:MAG: hypothetical protein KatS3mg024_1321 [Armatimonadota bacterium]|nr:MAG: hypothetical protein KatS3mg024_1321 [Armatimonadota bacterium]
MAGGQGAVFEDRICSDRPLTRAPLRPTGEGDYNKTPRTAARRAANFFAVIFPAAAGPPAFVETPGSPCYNESHELPGEV